MDGMKRHQITASLPRNSGDSKRSVDILDEDDKFLNSGSNFSQHKQRNKYRYFHDDNHASVVGVNDNKLYRHQIMSAQKKLAQQTQQSFPTSATVRKTRSNSFHEDRDQSDDLTSDPEVALRLLQHQNRRQRCRLNEIQQENFMLLKLSSTNNDKPSNLNRRSDFFSALNQHLGCRLDLLNNKIDSQQLVIDSMNEQYQQQLAMPNHLKHFDVAMLQKLFNEQSVIDQCNKTSNFVRTIFNSSEIFLSAPPYSNFNFSNFNFSNFNFSNFKIFFNFTVSNPLSKRIIHNFIRKELLKIKIFDALVNIKLYINSFNFQVIQLRLNIAHAKKL
ncbi:hypothetical protein HELRODRAFT_158317 [Helobdella robusta]|uniref:Uncharacterized protein n=1 Tax=Helobdella robusta TaxID=6412 RepID=T1EMN1_HELRO|nr:hypothetical protein HELRODRAFT_158317 [Helobdella robusta]ESO11953.1 hypothetical protein HELRODRAFT_158317 [Helobdella robusta]